MTYVFPRPPGGIGERYAQGRGYKGMDWWIAVPFKRTVESYSTTINEQDAWMRQNARGCFFHYHTDFGLCLIWWCFQRREDAALASLTWGSVI